MAITNEEVIQKIKKALALANDNRLNKAVLCD